jgi:hypothetical protein
MSNNRKKLVPGCNQAIDAMKYEIAAEIGLMDSIGASYGSGADTEFASELGSASGQSKRDGYWGNVTSRDAGYVGGNITARLIRKAEEALFSL